MRNFEIPFFDLLLKKTNNTNQTTGKFRMTSFFFFFLRHSKVINLFSNPLKQ